jgi:hypothetical protein
VISDLLLGTLGIIRVRNKIGLGMLSMGIVPITRFTLKP